MEREMKVSRDGHKIKVQTAKDVLGRDLNMYVTTQSKSTLPETLTKRLCKEAQWNNHQNSVFTKIDPL